MHLVKNYIPFIKKQDSAIAGLVIYLPKRYRMKTLSIVILIVIVTGFAVRCQPAAKEKKVGGGCEGCEAVFEYGSKNLNAVDTLPDWNDKGQKLEITGTIYHKDGKTPAKDVILYIYHTDQSGIYPTRGNERGNDRRHGYIRGWIKTGADGRYAFYTLVPGAYPGRQNPSHIHPVIKEPGYSEYWIDEYLFDDDPILTQRERGQQQKRGGSGILKTKKRPDGVITATRDIILGMNVPGY
jgi:protocatechuate 3,4-dioxygenase, beta subunit